MTTPTNPQKHRMEFVLLLDVENGNPNGDPDAGNMPRVDPETGHGLVTDVCLKRKVRDYIQLVRHPEDQRLADPKNPGKDPTHAIYIRAGAAGDEYLKGRRKAFYDRLKKKPADKDPATVNAVKANMCRTHYDIRAFGAVMPGECNGGQVRGPVQMTFARSLSPVFPLDNSITRLVKEDKGEKSAASDNEDAEGADRRGTFGRKHIIPYGLYQCSGFISPHFATETGFNSDDLALFWDALENMFDHDRSAARGFMAARRLVVFTHQSPLGNCPAHKTLERVKVRKMDDDKPPREFANYKVEIDEDKMPKGVMVEVKF